MAFIPTPHGARVVINWIKGTETFSYTFYATKDGYDTAAQQSLAIGIDAIHNGTRKSYFAAQVTYLNTTVYDARVSDGVIVSSNLLTGPGTSASEALPINTAVCVTLRSSGRGRSSRGRKYITGFGEGNNTSGEWSAVTVGNALNYVNAIIQAMTDYGWSCVIRSIQQDKVVQNPANTRVVTSVLVRNNKVATQRRRVDRP